MVGMEEGTSSQTACSIAKVAEKEQADNWANNWFDWSLEMVAIRQVV